MTSSLQYSTSTRPSGGNQHHQSVSSNSINNSIRGRTQSPAINTTTITQLPNSTSNTLSASNRNRYLEQKRSQSYMRSTPAVNGNTIQQKGYTRERSDDRESETTATLTTKKTLVTNHRGTLGGAIEEDFKTLYLNNDDHRKLSRISPAVGGGAGEINSYFKLESLPQNNKNLLLKPIELIGQKQPYLNTNTIKYRENISTNYNNSNFYYMGNRNSVGTLISTNNSNNKESLASKIISNNSKHINGGSAEFYAINSNSHQQQQSGTFYQTIAADSSRANSGMSNANMETRGIVGLKNLGNTCFMNSILQCLSNTRFLTEYCLQGNYTPDLNTTLSTMKGSLFRSYALLIKSMWKNDDSTVNPQDFKSQIARFAPKFSGYAQQDAEEFLYYLLKGLHEDVNLIKKKPPAIKFDEAAWDRMNVQQKSEEHWSNNLRIDKSAISDMFVGQLKSTLKCTKCDYRSPTFELFWHLAVPIPKQSTPVRLDDCIKLFMAEEFLDGDNKPTCSKCKEKRRCSKRYTIERLPKVLVIHLKRFLKVRYNNKINLNVDYPIENLDMSKYFSSNIDPESLDSPQINSNSHSYNVNCLYDLHSISLHSGTESSGHYIAYSKNPYNKKWYCFNDSMVREIGYNSLQDSSAYILFYQLKT